MGYEVTAVEDVTGYPPYWEVWKTLHPKVFGGILNRQEVSGDQTALSNLKFHKSIWSSIYILLKIQLHRWKRTRNYRKNRHRGNCTY